MWVQSNVDASRGVTAAVSISISIFVSVFVFVAVFVFVFVFVSVSVFVNVWYVWCWVTKETSNARRYKNVVCHSASTGTTPSVPRQKGPTRP